MPPTVTAQDFRDLFVQYDAEVTRIATYIEELLAKVGRASGLSDSEEAEVLDLARAELAKLKATAPVPAAEPAPSPDVEPTPTPGTEG